MMARPRGLSTAVHSKNGKSSRSLLWVHGKRPTIPYVHMFITAHYPLVIAGSSKSILAYIIPGMLSYLQEFIFSTSSAIIEDIKAMCQARLASFVYFYFDIKVKARHPEPTFFHALSALRRVRPFLLSFLNCTPPSVKALISQVNHRMST